MSAVDEIIRGLGRPCTAQASLPLQGPGAQLRSKWVAERAAPELLEYQQDLVEGVRTITRALVARIEECLFEEDAESDLKLQLLIVETELERLKLVARQYLRTRLAKLDENAAYYQAHPERLSREEKEYLDRHQKLRADLYGASFLGAWPAALQDLNANNAYERMVDEPEMEKPVVVRALATLPEPLRVGPDTVEAVEGHLYILRYSACTGDFEFV